MELPGEDARRSTITIYPGWSDSASNYLTTTWRNRGVVLSLVTIAPLPTSS